MLLPMVASAYDIAVENTDGVIIYYNYINDGKELAVTYNGSSFDSDEEYSGNVVIPQEVTYLNQTYKVTSIDGDAFNGCTALTSVTIPNSVTSTGWRIFRYCSSLTSVTLSNNLTSISDGAFQYCSSLVSITIPNSVTSIGWSAFNKCYSLASITIPNSVTEIVSYAFGSCSSLTSITIGSGISSIGLEAFENCTKLTDIFCYADNVPSTNSDAFKDTPIENVTLHVPAASVSSYSGTAPWSDFNTIESIAPENIAIGDLGIGTFCGSNPLDLSSTEDVKAYVVSSFESATGQVTLTRTYYVPPFTGVVVKGNKGIYTIPAGVGQPVYPNMMKGVTANIVLNKVDGDYTNYILAKKNGNLGFYAVSDGSTLSARKAYLPLPTVNLPSGAGARGLQFIYDDEQATDITEIESKNDAIVGIYNLQGRKVINPTKGLYVINGKKVIIK